MAGTSEKSVVDSIAQSIANKQTRSFIFLLLSFIVILGLNSVLPVLEGEAHYTAEAVNMTYSEYINQKEEDQHLRLTWVSEVEIDLYISDYIKAHPELTPEERVTVSVPDSMPVRVYTKFFYEYPFWYIATITSLGSAVILYYSLFNYLTIRAREKNADYLKISKQVDMMSNRHLDPTTFEPWIENVFNRKRKLKQHERNVKYRLDLLESKTAPSIKTKYKEYFKLKDPTERASQYGVITEKKERKYLEKKEQLLSLLDPDYVEQYVVDGTVKYFRYIHPMFVYNGVSTLSKTTDEYSSARSDGERIAKDAGPKILISLTVTILFAVLFTVTAVASVEKQPFWVVVNIVSKMAPLLIQIPLAFDYSRAFMENHLITNLIHRRSIGLLYLADMDRTKGSTTAQNLKKELYGKEFGNA